MKIDKSQLFRNAWNIAKAAAIKFNDKAKVFFSESLKQAWKAAKNAGSLDALKKIGNEWQKGNYHRIYFDIRDFLNHFRHYR